MTEAALEQAETFDEDVATQQAEAAAATPEQPEGQESASETPAPDTEGAAGHRSAERRIAQLTAKYRQEQREKQELVERLERLESRIGPEPGPTRPQPDDYETTEEYEDALFQWNDDRREHAKKQEARKKPEAPAIPEPIKEKLPEFDKQVKALTAINQDATALIFSDDWPCTDEMMEIIVSSDRGAELAYKLAQNPAEADRIAHLTPLQQARELTRIEAGLPASQLPATSKAPPPITPVKARGSSEVDPEKMSYADWKKHREEQLAKRNS